MVTTRQKATSNRRVTRRSRSTVVYNKRKRKKLSFQDYDNKLTSLRKKQQIWGVSKAAGLTNQADAIDKTSNINDETNSTRSTENKTRPVRKATRAALASIGKVINYEEKVTDIVNDRDDDSTFLTPLDNLQVPELPPIVNNGFDDGSALTLNNSAIELWQQSHKVSNCNKKDTNSSDNESQTTLTDLSKGDEQLERHTTHQRTSSVSQKKQMYAAPSIVNITVIDENKVLNDDITANKSDSGKTLNDTAKK